MTDTITALPAPFDGAPRIGMGCWAIGGLFRFGEAVAGYAGANDSDARAALEASWEAGVRVFDTAAVYGTGHSEDLIGSVIADRPGAIVVSKIGFDFDAETKSMHGPRTDPAFIEASVEASRQRLRRDQVDVMLLHLNDLAIAEAEPIFDRLDTLRARGTIGAYGWSTDFPDRAAAFADRPGFVGVQHAMNVLIDAPSMTETAERTGLVQMVRSPLAMGLLTGKYGPDRRIAQDDVRNHSQGWNDYFEDRAASPRYAAQIAAVRDLLSVGGRTLTQGALGWLLARSPRALPVPGAKSAAQAEENAGAIALGPLPQGVMDEIEAILDRPAEGPPRAR
ncbi:MAG: aldo/keto reductase [Pseudomonadota bacterium]